VWSTLGRSVMIGTGQSRAVFEIREGGQTSLSHCSRRVVSSGDLFIFLLFVTMELDWIEFGLLLRMSYKVIIPEMRSGGSLEF